jgi:hypothetical protein
LVEVTARYSSLVCIYANLLCDCVKLDVAINTVDNEFTSLREVVKFCPAPRRRGMRNEEGYLFSDACLKIDLVISSTPCLNFI